MAEETFNETETQLEVKSIALNPMQNAAYVEFMTKFQTVLQGKPVVIERLAPMPTTFDQLLERAHKALVAERGSALTVSLSEADQIRDNLHRALCHVVEAHCLHSNSDNSQAAVQLRRIIKQYGTTSLRESGYDDETALIRSLVADLSSTENSTLSNQIGITSWIDDLTTANNNFEQVMAERMQEGAASLNYTTGDVRKQLTPLFRKIVQAVETFAMLGIDPQFSELITELNAQIDYKK